MKHQLLILLTVIALAGFTSLGLAAEKKIRGENTPIHRAIRELRDARAYLEHAPHDFGGHRVDAIKQIDESLRQLELALKFDRAHEKP